MSDTRVTVVCQRAYGPNWWAAKCTRCGVYLTKYDHSPEEAESLALSELAKHRCRR